MGSLSAFRTCIVYAQHRVSFLKRVKDNMDSLTHPIPNHLAQLWQHTLRDQSLAFLRRAFAAEMTLNDVLTVLQYPELKLDKSNVSLRDVLQASPAPAAEFTAPAARPAAAAAPAPTPAPSPAVFRAAAPVPRTRRRPEQTAAIKEKLLQALRAADNGLRTHELADVLEKEGFANISTATTNIMLKTLEVDGLLQGNHSRPKVWRAKIQGRRVPEPILIRRPTELRVVPEAAAVEAPAAVPTQTHLAEVPKPANSEGRATELLSQTEVTAAANLLRERFFKQT
jgi:hypothetical protein